jgi:hypothetical protein
MSTKCSIKWREQTDAAPGFHLYDCLDEADECQETPVYLRLDGVPAEMQTQRDGATVTVALPREMARALGLLPAA